MDYRAYFDKWFTEEIFELIYIESGINKNQIIEVVDRTDWSQVPAFPYTDTTQFFKCPDVFVRLYSTSYDGHEYINQIVINVSGIYVYCEGASHYDAIGFICPHQIHSLPLLVLRGDNQITRR